MLIPFIYLLFFFFAFSSQQLAQHLEVLSQTSDAFGQTPGVQLAAPVAGGNTDGPGRGEAELGEASEFCEMEEAKPDLTPGGLTVVSLTH